MRERETRVKSRSGSRERKVPRVEDGEKGEARQVGLIFFLFSRTAGDIFARQVESSFLAFPEASIFYSLDPIDREPGHTDGPTHAR